MGFFILLLFIGVPVIEIATFIQVGDIIGLWPTLSIVILTAFIGTALLRQQGLSTLMNAQKALNEGRMPAEELFDAACLLIAGAFLLTPGFVTDSIGFLLFFPPFRLFLRHQMTRFVKNNASIHIVAGAPKTDPDDKKSTVIDAEFEDITPNPESPWGAKDSLPKD